MVLKQKQITKSKGEERRKKKSKRKENFVRNVKEDK